MKKLNWSSTSIGFICKNKKKQSMLLRDEAAQTICEYATNKMIVAIHEADLLVINDWQDVRMIKQQYTGNINKDFIIPLPDFDEQRFPFLLCSGYQHICLVNIRKHILTSFIIASCPTAGSQQAFFFCNEKYGYSLHFTTNEHTDENMEYHKWHQLQLK